MNRQTFGSWGIELDQDDFACAIAALGVLSRHWNFYFTTSQTEIERRLAAALGDGEAPVAYAWNIAEDIGSFERTTSAESLARAWRATLARCPAPRLEISSPNVRIFDQPWIVNQLSRPVVRAASVYVLRNLPLGTRSELLDQGSLRFARDSSLPQADDELTWRAALVDLRWEWPVRVGFLPDPVSQRLRAELAGTHWSGVLAELVTVPSLGVECDLLLLPFDVPGALLGLLASPEMPRASCIMVLGGAGAGANNLGARILMLQGEVGAGGAAVAQVGEAFRREWFIELVEQLSHDQPIDVALARSLQRVSAPPPLFAASRLLVELTHVSRNAEALRRKLDRLDPKHEVVLESFAADRLGLPQGPISARSAASALFASMNSFIYQHEGGDASTIAAVSRAYRTLSIPAEPGTVASRRIQSRVYDFTHPREPALLTRAMRARAPHAIDVRIGLSDATWTQFGEAFPAEKLPPGDTPRRLTVVFTEPRFAAEPQVGTIVLPPSGNSNTTRFFLHTGERTDRIDARITVLYENRVLQTARLVAGVVEYPEEAPKGAVVPERGGALGAAVVEHPKEVPEGSAIALEPETFVSMDLTDLGDRRRFDAALVLNHTGGEPQATAIAGEYACLVSLGNVDTWVGNLVDKLSSMARADDSYASLDAPKVSDLFYYLASQGSLLFEALCDGMTPTLKDTLLTATRIQVVAAKQGSLLPIEFAYGYRAPVAGATLCPGAREALEKGSCPGSCPKGTAKKTVICPLGFWGLNRVIERQSDGALPLAGTGAEFGIRVTGGPRKRLDLLKSALFAASSRADGAIPGSTHGVRDALAGATHDHLAVASSWTSWVEGVKSATPSLLVLIVHTDTDKKSGLQLLEIGQGDPLTLKDIYEEYVHADDKVSPVVLLVGCQTSVSEIAFQQFPVQFQRRGAALVLGTVATILGRHAGPVTARLVTALAELTAKGDVLFGDALLATKQKLVAEGKLMAMCLCAHGDAGWILGESTREEAKQ